MKRAQLLKDVMDRLEHGFEQNKNRHMKVMIDRDLQLEDEDQKLIAKFCSMCSNALGIEEDYKCYLSNDRKKAKIVTSAICDFSRSNIRVYCHKRSLADILRSIAHEMYHLRQNELNLVPRVMRQHHVNPIEWHANAAAGSLLSFFAQKVGRDKIYR